MLKESDILYEQCEYWIKKSEFHYGFDIYRNGITHAIRCAEIGYPGNIGIEKAIKEVERRILMGE